MKKRMSVLCAVIFLWVSGIAMADDEIYKSEFGEVQIKEQKDGSLLFSVSVTVPQLNGFNCTGGLEGTAKKISGNEYVYQDKEQKDCNIKIIFVNDDIALTERDCSGYCGLGCKFEDFYRKAADSSEKNIKTEEDSKPEASVTPNAENILKKQWIATKTLSNGDNAVFFFFSEKCKQGKNELRQAEIRGSAGEDDLSGTEKLLEKGCWKADIKSKQIIYINPQSKIIPMIKGFKGIIGWDELADLSGAN